LSAPDGLEVARLGPGLWSWRVGSEPASWYVETADAVLLVDPLPPPAGSRAAERFWRHLDDDVERLRLPLEIVLLAPARVGAACEAQRRYGDAARVRGEARVGALLAPGVPFAPLAPGDVVAAGARAVDLNGRLALRLAHAGATIVSHSLLRDTTP
jgi:hypothetical protein